MRRTAHIVIVIKDMAFMEEGAIGRIDVFAGAIFFKLTGGKANHLAVLVP